MANVVTYKLLTAEYDLANSIILKLLYCQIS